VLAHQGRAPKAAQCWSNLSAERPTLPCTAADALKVIEPGLG
jgi:hypothetical protein